MANVKERIETIKDYFLGMDVKDGLVSVAVKFPKKWIILEGLDEKYGIVIDECKNTKGSPYAKEQGSFYFAASLEDGFDVAFDAIDENISVMKAAEERVELLEIKTKELKDLFDDEENSLEKLKTLEFTFRSELQLPKKRNQKREQEENNNNGEESGESN